MKKIVVFLLLLSSFFVVKAEGEATLKNIRVNGKECKCVGYSCEVEVSAKSVIVTYELVDPAAEVDRASGFSKDLTSPQTIIKIVVSNEVGEEKRENTYEITINQHEKSGDYTLNSLKVNDTEMTLTEEVFVYNYSAEYNLDKIVIKATTKDPNAKIISKLEHDFPLDSSSLAIDVEVKAENEDVKTYRVVVVRKAKPNTFLKSLKLDKANIEFKKDTLEYHTTVEYAVNSLLVEAVAEDENAKIKIEKEDLVVGENKIKVIVTLDKAETVYTILVNREPNLDKSQANLKSLTIEEYPKLDFEPNVLDYKLKFSNIPEKLSIKATPENSDAKIEIVGNENLADQEKVVVKVTLNLEEDLKITREYTLDIVLNKSISDNKTVIIISMAILFITMIVLFILQIKESKNKRKIKLNKIKELRFRKHKKNKKEEEEIEII